MSRIKRQNSLEETCKSVHKWLLSVYLNKTTKWQGTLFSLGELHVYCEVINQCLARIRIPQHQSFTPNWNIPWSPYQIVVWGENRNVPLIIISIALYCKVINQWLTERIPQHKASHLTGIHEYLVLFLCACTCVSQKF